MPPLGPNMKLKTTGSVVCASNFEIECINGYRLQGAHVATCLPGSSHFWHGAMPSCI